MGAYITRYIPKRAVIYHLILVFLLICSCGVSLSRAALMYIISKTIKQRRPQVASMVSTPISCMNVPLFSGLGSTYITTRDTAAIKQIESWTRADGSSLRKPTLKMRNTSSVKIMTQEMMVSTRFISYKINGSPLDYADI